MTAFLVESLKNLRQDSNEASVALLSQILISLDGQIKPQSSNSVIAPYSPTPSNVRVNTLWFLSLVFSLATVLIGIISLQWIREYQKARDDLEPREAYSLHRMHTEAFERWYVPQTIGALPLLLQIGLVLFLAGTMDLLWHLNATVASLVTVAISLVLAFLTLTTVLPTLQAVSLLLPRWPARKIPRVQCPYKSPQALAFHHLIVLYHHLSRYLARHWWNKPYPGKSRWNTCNRFPTRLFLKTWDGDPWLQYGREWLLQRDGDCIAAQHNAQNRPYGRLTLPVVPMYDAVQGISSIRWNSIYRKETQAFAAYKCFCELSRSHYSSAGVGPRIQAFLESSYLHILRSRRFKLNDPAVLIENGILDFLSIHSRFSSIRGPLILAQHAAEICIRMTSWMYSSHPRTIDASVQAGSHCLPIEWVEQQCKSSSELISIENTPGECPVAIFTDNARLISFLELSCHRTTLSGTLYSGSVFQQRASAPPR